MTVKLTPLKGLLIAFIAAVLGLLLGNSLLSVNVNINVVLLSVVFAFSLIGFLLGGLE